MPPAFYLMPEIETARLRLRLFTPEDLDGLAGLFADPEVMTYLGAEAGRTMSREESTRALENTIRGWRERGYGRWAVVDKESGRFIGLCGLKSLGGEAELIYALGKAYWGRGLATEAAGAALRYAFEEAGLERVVAVTRHGNVASRRVLTRVGMRYEGEGSYYGVEGVCYGVSLAEFRPSDSAYVLLRD